MDWQSALAAAIATACATWVAWATVRPFAGRLARGCGLCPGCGPVKTSGDRAGVGARLPGAAELLHIAPPRPPRRGVGAV